jgi:phage FluMu gp28-like protein
MQLAESAVETNGAHRVQPITFTPGVKSDLAARLRVLVENARIRIPADDTIRRDWHSLRRAITPAGYFRFDATRNNHGHADRFWAAALAVHAAAGPPGPPESLTTPPLVFARKGIW